MTTARLWFTPKSTRRISIRNWAGLVGKAPEKRKRLKLLVTDVLTGQRVTGFPTWLADARDFTMKTGDPVKPKIVIPYCNVTFTEQQLFGPGPIEAPKAKLSHFSVENMGSSEDPVTVVKFQILAPFSTDLNRWAGQMGGEEFDVSYKITEAPEEDDEDEEEDEEEDALAGEEEEEEDELKAQARRREENKQLAAAKKNLGIVTH